MGRARTIVGVALLAVAGVTLWGLRGRWAETDRAGEQEGAGAAPRGAGGLAAPSRGIEPPTRVGAGREGAIESEDDTTEAGPMGGPTSRFRGVVVDDEGEPVPAVAVILQRTTGRRTRLATNDQGRFDGIAPVDDGLVHASFEAADHEGLSRPFDPSDAALRVVLWRQADTTLRIRLEKHAVEDGTWVRGRLRKSSEDGHDFEARVQDGELIARLSAVRFGVYELFLRAPDFDGGPVRVDVVARGTETLVRVPLSKRTTDSISGIVRSADGSPLAKASVFALADDGDEFEPVRESKTDGSGRFRVEGLPRGAVSFWVHAIHHESVIRVPSTDLEIREQPLARVRGRSSRPPSPTSRFTVDCAVRGVPPAVAWSAVECDAAGRFDLQLPAGTWELRLEDGPEAGATKSLTVAPGSSTEDVLLEAPAVPDSVHGFVQDSGGRPVVWAWVKWYEQGRADVPPEVTQTTEEGRFHLRTRANTRGRVEAFWDQGWGEVRDVLSGGEPVAVVLAREGSIDGRLRSARTSRREEGKIVARRVEARSTGSIDDPDSRIVRDVPFGAGGHFLMDFVPPGRHRLSARAGSEVLWPPVEVDVATGSHLSDLRLDMVEGGSLDVQLRGADGRPQEGASVRLENAWELPPPPGRTDAEGRVRFVGLVPGRWRVLTFRYVGSDRLTADALVALGQSTSIVLTRRRGRRRHGVGRRRPGATRRFAPAK